MAQATDGRASFRRAGTASATLEIDYDVDAGTVSLPDGDLREGVADLCDREIDQMRETLSDLGEDLASQLSDDGKGVHVNRNWRNTEHRTWDDRLGSFTVDGSHTRTVERMNGCEGVSDVALVREYVRLLIGQREENIRGIYGQILRDASARRGETIPGQNPA